MSNTDWIASGIHNGNVLDEADRVIITGSMTDANAFAEIENAHAIAMPNVKHAQFAAYLKDHYPKIKYILMLDADEPGQARAIDLESAMKRAGLKVYRADGDIYAGAKNAAAASKEHGAGLLAALLQPIIDQAAEAFAEADREAMKNDYITGDDLIAQRRKDSEAARKGTPTGLKTLDYAIGNGLPNELTIIGAGSSLGKTTLALQIADNIAMTGRDVLYYSLEMSVGDMVNRSLSRMSYDRVGGKPLNALNVTTGICKGGTDVSARVAELESHYSREIAPWMHYKHPTGGIRLFEIREAARRFADWKGRAPVIFVDYIQIIRRDDVRMSDKQAADEVVTQLQDMALELETPVIGISSVNRANYQERISMSAFKESGGIEFTAAVAIGLQLYGAGTFIGTGKQARGIDVEYEKKRDVRRVQALILKNRHGVAGRILPFDYPAAYNCFQEISGNMRDDETGTSLAWEKPKYKEIKIEGGAEGKSYGSDTDDSDGPTTID